MKLDTVLGSEDFDVAFLLGTFEKELHPYIEKTRSLQIDLIINVGSSWGLYAVGMALRDPNARIIAFETDLLLHPKLRELAAANKISARLDVLGTCEPQDLKRVVPEDRTSLVICDVEGYEQCLLDPKAIPALRAAHILVEAHECFVHGISDEIQARFQASHHITVIKQTPRSVTDIPDAFLLAKLLPKSLMENAIREPRSSRDVWLWMEPKPHRAGRQGSASGTTIHAPK